MDKSQFRQILESLSVIREDKVRVWPTTNEPVGRKDILLAGMEYTLEQFGAEAHCMLDEFDFDEECRDEEERDRGDY